MLFPHLLMPRLRDTRRVRMVQSRTVFFEQSNRCIDSSSLIGTENLPPSAELIRVFNLPRHNHLCPRRNIPSRE